MTTLTTHSVPGSKAVSELSTIPLAESDEINVIINPNNCMARKNKTTGKCLQCPYKKKNGDFCNIHAKMEKVNRIDQNLPGNLELNLDLPLNLAGKIPIKKKINIIKQIPLETKPKKIIRIRHTKAGGFPGLNKGGNMRYMPAEFRSLTPSTVNYSRLIRTLRYHLININGNTEQLFQLVTEFFQNKWIDPESKTVNSPLLETLSGPGFKEREKCDNPSDFYDLTPLSEIPDVYFFSFSGDNNKIYGCDFRSFHQLVLTVRRSLNNRDMNIPGQSNAEITNPYNRSPIGENTIKNYEEKKWLLEQNHIPVTYPVEELDEETKFKFLVLDVFQAMYGFGYAVDHEWFMNLEQSRLSELYNKLEDIWNYRLQLTSEQKRKIVPNNDIFSGSEKIQVQKYVGLHPENKKKLRRLLINIIKKMVTEGETKADCINGTIYVLTGLVDVSPEAATALPGIVYVAGVNDFGAEDY